jgi:hypothetical protein
MAPCFRTQNELEAESLHVSVDTILGLESGKRTLARFPEDSEKPCVRATKGNTEIQS